LEKNLKLILPNYLAKNLGCNKETIAELERRGLTREAIEAAGIFTLPAGRTEVSYLVHESFPGTYWTQDYNCIRSQWIKGMWVDGAGRDSIVIPRFSFWDASRIGCQLRALGEVEKCNRYRPLYYYNKDTDYKPASGNRLQWGDNGNHEPGLTFCNPEMFGRKPEIPSRVYLCEAILKPLIASFKHNEIFVGAVSGNFLTSPEQLHDILTYLKAIGTTELVIAPDNNTFPTKEKPDGNPGIVTQWTKIYLWIHKNFPEVFDIMVAPAAGADIDEVNVLPELIPFQAWLAGSISSSKETKKMVNRLRRQDKGNRFGLAEVWGTVRSLVKKVQAHARDVRQYFAKKSSAIVLWSDHKRWESIYQSCPLKPDWLIYDPDNLDSINWRGDGPMPLIYYNPEEMVSPIKDVHHELGKRHFLNTGEPGTGKSHKSSSAHPDDFDLERENVLLERKNGEVEQCGHEPKIWYLTNSPKNPTNAPLEENFEALPSRAERLYAGDKTTPSGRSYHHSHDGNGKYVPIPNSGNCGRAESHKALMALGYSHQETTGLLCPTCPFYEPDPKKAEDGKPSCNWGIGSRKVRDERSGPNDTDFPYGFIFQRWSRIKDERQISLHPNQAPTRRLQDGLIGISPISDVVVWDDLLPQTTKDYYVNIAGVRAVIAQLALNEHRMKEKGDDEQSAIAGQLPWLLMPMLGYLIKNIFDKPAHQKLPHGMGDRQFWIEYCKAILRTKLGGYGPVGKQVLVVGREI